MALADGDGASAEDLDLTSKAMAREERPEQTFGPDEKPVFPLASDAEYVEVDAVLGVVGELADLLHALADEVVHGAVVGFSLHVQEGVHGGQFVPQLSDLPADGADLAKLFAHAVPSICAYGQVDWWMKSFVMAGKQRY
jgi:hypothetical protein